MKSTFTPIIRSPRRFAVALILIAAVIGCSGARQARLDLLYTPAASHHGPDRNPIVVIPGVMGSSLVDRATGAKVWGGFDGIGADPGTAEGARLIALPFDGGDLVEPTGVLERVRIRLAGIPMQLEVYARILSTLGVGGYRDEALGTAGAVRYGSDHFTCFQFAYDWRQDNVQNAARLHEFLLDKRRYVEAEYRRRYGDAAPAVKFDIVAHSMGAVLTRYFLRYGGRDLPSDGSLPTLDWAGAELVERAVLIAPPNAGSIDSLQALVDGRRAAPTLPRYPPAILGTFPSAYQLLPRQRHARVVAADGAAMDLFDPTVWRRLGWGLSSPDQADVLQVLMPAEGDADERRRKALTAQENALVRARSFTSALDRDAAPPPGLEIFLVAGDAIETPSRAMVDADGKIRVVERSAGDGTVLRSSVLLDERVGSVWGPTLVTPIHYRSVLLLPESHLGITKNAAFRDNMLFWLLEEPRRERAYLGYVDSASERD